MGSVLYSFVRSLKNLYFPIELDKLIIIQGYLVEVSRAAYVIGRCDIGSQIEIIAKKLSWFGLVTISRHKLHNRPV